MHAVPLDRLLRAQFHCALCVLQGGKGKADEQASSPSRRKTKGRPKARGMGNPQASNLIDAEAKCG